MTRGPNKRNIAQRKGIANAAMDDKLTDTEAQALVIAKVPNALKEQNDQQMKTMMSMFKKILTSMHPAGTMLTATIPPKAPSNCTPRTECPHCNKKHCNHDKCWELEANKTARLENWKSAKST